MSDDKEVESLISEIKAKGTELEQVLLEQRLRELNGKALYDRTHPPGESLIGYFNLPPEAKLGVWDPCYGEGDVFEAKPGIWKASIEISDEGGWGRRVSRLWVQHEKYRPTGLWDKVLVRDAGVDSGQMGIYAVPLNVSLRPDTREDDYERICGLTSPAGMLPYGVVSSSGYGDGGYPVYGELNKDGELVAVMVEFIGECDEDDVLDDTEEEEDE